MTPQALAAAIAKRQEVFRRDLPTHPTVDWNQLQIRNGIQHVQVTCPFCQVPRVENAHQVKYRVRTGIFTGCCYKDRLIKKRRRDRIAEFSPHPQIDWDDTVILVVGSQRLTHAAVTCPDCGTKRYERRHSLANMLLRFQNYSARCKSCRGYNPANNKRWAVLSPGRKKDPHKGYIHLGLCAVDPADHELFKQMRATCGYVTEHRFAMAKVLGRPLTKRELVDHMDGDKTNNAISNLRIYVKGKNQPGAHHGYGTYYHEWQLALARINDLERQLGH